MRKRGTWILFGDLNIVRSREERRNCRFCASSAYWFNRFIDMTELHDLRMGGHRYTFYCQTEAKLSKLDRFLVCPTSSTSSRLPLSPLNLENYRTISLSPSTSRPLISINPHFDSLTHGYKENILINLSPPHWVTSWDMELLMRFMRLNWNTSNTN